MKSSACSRLSLIDGVSRTVMSEVDERTLLCFFSLVILNAMSSGRELIPTIMPSYTATCGSTKVCVRSCAAAMAKEVTTPVSLATSTPLRLPPIGPCQGS